MRKLFLSFIFSICVAATASAATINVDFSTDGDVTDGNYQFGDTLIIRSYNPQNSVVQSSAGLGVYNEYLDSPNETLRLYFSEEVSNLTLTFSNWDSQTDSLHISTHGVEVLRRTCCHQELPPIDEDGVIQFLHAITYLNLAIFGDDDVTSIALKSASWDDGAPSVVPLPAALPLYGAGMGFMGFLAWRKRRKSA
jgi:hypothetical protein